MPSPLCLVQGSAPPVDVASGGVVTIQLADLAGVDQWSIACIDTDGGRLPATINAGLTIDPIAKSATFGFPADGGSALIFQSVVNQGKDINETVQPSYTCTFIIHSLLSNGLHLFALNEVWESNVEVGWTGHLNDVARTVPSAASVVALAGATSAATPSVLALRDSNAACAFKYLTVGDPGGFIPTTGAIRMAGGEALVSGDPSGDDVVLIYADATTGSVNIGDNISGTGIVLWTQVVFENGTVQFADLAGPVSFSQGQSTTGAGHPWANYGQRGKAGSIGGTYTIGGGLGGTLHTNLPGDTQLDLRGAVSNVGPKALFLTDAGNLSINQTAASTISITSPVAFTTNVTGTFAATSTLGATLSSQTAGVALNSGTSSGTPTLTLNGLASALACTFLYPHNGACSVSWASTVTSVLYTQAQSTTGIGNGITLRAQQGLAGSVGGTTTIQGGLGGTPGTNLPGPIDLELGQTVSNVSGKASFTVGGTSILDVYQSTASVTSIQQKPGTALSIGDNGASSSLAVNANTTITIEGGGNLTLSSFSGSTFIESASRTKVITCDTAGNICLWGAGAGAGLGGGALVLSIANATTVPTTNPTGGGILYAQGGALKWRGSSGTVTTLGPA